jgi:hypothetical protein
MRVRGGRDRQDHQLFPPALSDPRRFDGLRLPASFIPAGAAPLVAIKLGNIATVARKPR